MKRYLIMCYALLGGAIVAHAQVGIGIKKPSDSAMLHIHSEQGNQGLIIPKVALTDVTIFAPVKGDPSDPVNIGLLVFNSNDNYLDDLSHSFYYWSGSKWLRIVDEDLLNRILDDYIEYELPVGPEIKGTYEVRYNEKEKNFYTVKTDSNGDPHAEKIPINELIQRDETPTNLTRRFDLDSNKIGAYTLFDKEPIAEKGKVVYNYKAEGDKNYYIDITQDILESIQNNDRIRTEIINLIQDGGQTNQGGNVYYGAFDETQEERLYRYEENTSGELEKKVINIGSHILDFFEKASEEVHETVRNAIGYNISNQSVSTGNKYEGEVIYVFSDKLSIKSNDAEVSVVIPNEVQGQINTVFSIAILDQNGNALNVGTTEVILNTNRINFALGAGSVYTTLPEGEYTAVVEFLKK
ncbi:hypothetical protein [Myroides sp. LJL119]